MEMYSSLATFWCTCSAPLILAICACMNGGGRCGGWWWCVFVRVGVCGGVGGVQRGAKGVRRWRREGGKGGIPSNNNSISLMPAVHFQLAAHTGWCTQRAARLRAHACAPASAPQRPPARARTCISDRMPSCIRAPPLVHTIISARPSCARRCGRGCGHGRAQACGTCAHTAPPAAQPSHVCAHSPPACVRPWLAWPGWPALAHHHTRARQRPTCHVTTMTTTAHAITCLI